MQSQRARRLRDISTRTFQSARDQSPPGLPHRVVKSARFFVLGCLNIWQEIGQIVGRDYFRGTQHDGAFDDVLEFSDIAGQS